MDSTTHGVKLLFNKWVKWPLKKKKLDPDFSPKIQHKSKIYTQKVLSVKYEKTMNVFTSSEGFSKHDTKFQKIQKKYDCMKPSQGKAYIHY